MARGKSKYNTGRDPGCFIALPWSVLDSTAYQGLSHPAKALLLEIARQYVRDNNGRLLCTDAYLKPRGWKSTDVITRAKRELLAAGLIFETCKGARPNKASWYAITWYTLDKHPGYDEDTVGNFRRGAYQEAKKVLTPSPGVGKPVIAPSPGVGKAATTPSPGAIEATFDHSSTPSPGDHLDKPSAGALNGKAVSGRKTANASNQVASGLH